MIRIPFDPRIASCTTVRSHPLHIRIPVGWVRLGPTSRLRSGDLVYVALTPAYWTPATALFIVGRAVQGLICAIRRLPS